MANLSIPFAATADAEFAVPYTSIRYAMHDRKLASVPQPNGRPANTGTIQCVF
jgi:hypothetical protein